MGFPIDYFRKIFAKYEVKIDKNDYTINVAFEKLGKRLDRAQDALDAQVWADMQKYMPLNTGSLIAQTAAINKQTHGEVYLFPPNSDYGHYQYEGVKYVDPQYQIGAFYNPSYGFWSRPGIAKVPSSEPLFYRRESAEAHWDEVAAANHHKDWEKAAASAMKGR